MSYLIDTNVIFEFSKPLPNKKVMAWFATIPAEELYLSVLTLGEIRKGIEQIKDVQKREKLRFWLKHDLPNYFGEHILNIEGKVVDRWGRLQAGTKRTLPAIDGLIAATALCFDFVLVTRNIKDFDLLGLTLVNPWL